METRAAPGAAVGLCPHCSHWALGHPAAFCGFEALFFLNILRPASGSSSKRAQRIPREFLQGEVKQKPAACCSGSSAPYEPAENPQAALSWRLRWAPAPMRALIGCCVLGVPVGAVSLLRDLQHKVNPGWQGADTLLGWRYWGDTAPVGVATRDKGKPSPGVVMPPRRQRGPRGP